MTILTGDGRRRLSRSYAPSQVEVADLSASTAAASTSDLSAIKSTNTPTTSQPHLRTMDSLTTSGQPSAHFQNRRRQSTPSSRIPTPTVNRASPRTHLPIDHDLQGPHLPWIEQPALSRNPTPNKFGFISRAFHSDRIVSEPLPTVRKENIDPNKHRLLRQISPARVKISTGVPRSKTFNAFGNISRWSHKSSNSVAEIHPLSSPLNFKTSPTTSAIDSSSAFLDEVAAPLAEFSLPGVHEVVQSMQYDYWTGRFVGLSDRMNNDILEAGAKDQAGFEKYIAAANSNSSSHDNQKFSRWTSPKSSKTNSIFTPLDEDTKAKLIFAKLEENCKTEEAKKSFWEFQQQFARKSKNEKLLPYRGRMTSPEGFLGKMGSVMKGGSGYKKRRDTVHFEPGMKGGAPNGML